MTDELLPKGLGALPDGEDERDYPLEALYAAEELEPTPFDALPASYVVPGMPAVLDQHDTPMCVAYSSSTLKGWQDRRDQLRWFDFAEGQFFHQIGGTPAGARVRDAMASLLATGYPVKDTGDPGRHRIAAYFAVPVDATAIKAAILDLGPVILSTPWYRSWFRPSTSGTLPNPDTVVGGHAIVAYGWDGRGIRLRNSWGADWGREGDCWMPLGMLPRVNAAWKAADQVVHPVPYVRTVTVTASPGLRMRKAPKLGSPVLGSILHGRNVATRRLEKYGGRYEGPAGHKRTDWYEVSVRGRTGWIAKAYTR